MTIKILGTGCKNCQIVTANTKKALKNLQIDADVIKIENIHEIISMGVMSTPAIVINDKIKSLGKVLSVLEIEKLIK